MDDKIVHCIESRCGHAEFTITVGEQEFFADKGFELPKRCPDCRERRKQEKEERGDRVPTYGKRR